MPDRGFVRALSGEGRRVEYGTVTMGCSLPKCDSSTVAGSAASIVVVSDWACMADSKKLNRKFRAGHYRTPSELDQERSPDG
jgi:hypothetical protein